MIVDSGELRATFPIERVSAQEFVIFVQVS